MGQQRSRPQQLELGFLGEGLAPAVPAASALARRFHRDQAEAVLRVLHPDPNHRLRQLATVCPGALSLAASASTWGSWAVPPTTRFFEGVARGRKLGTLLLELLEALQFDRKDPLLGERLRRQRVLLRRASAGVQTERLIAWVPAVLVPEDVPTSPRENVRWYAWLAAGPLDLDRAGEPAVREVCSFLSRHLGAWWAMPCPPDAAELVGYAAHSRNLPARSCRPARWLADAERWLDATPHTVWHGRLVLQGARSLAALPGGAGPGWWVRPLRRLGDVVEEGRRQGHCLKNATPACLLPGPVRESFYAARVHGERLTVGLSIAGQHVRLEELRKTANQDPSEASRAVIEAWLAARAKAAGLVVVSS